MSSFPYLLVLLLLPLVGGIVVAGMGGATVRTAKLTALGFSLAEFVIAVLLWFDYRNFLTQGGGTSPFGEVVKVTWIRSFGIHFALGADGISLILIAMTCFLVPIVLGASWEEKLPAGRTITGYFALVLVFQSAMIGVFAATDVFLFYCFFEVMLIPMYFLVGYFGGPRRAYAATKFFLYSLLGGLLMLASVIGLYVASGHVLPEGTLDWETLRSIAHQIPESTQVWIFLGFAIAFAIKAPLVPFHTWLPEAGAEAPTGASTLLVTTMDKVGTFGFLRICLPLLPAASQKLVWLFLLLALLGIVYAAIVAAMQTDLKKFVTFTSIAHFGFIVMGVFAFTTQAMAGAVLYMLNHGIATGLLFVIVGMLIARGGSRQVADYGGVWKIAPVLGGIFLVATMATLALPGTNSFVSEFLVLIGTFQRHPAWAIIGTAGIILSSVYVLWIFQRTMTGPLRGAAVVDTDTAADDGVRGAAPELEPAPPAGGGTATAVVVEAPAEPKVKAGFGDLTPREIAVVAPLVAAIIFLGIYPKPVLDVIQPTVTATMHAVGVSDLAPATQNLNGGGN
ncbi:MAG: NADH-quinone oxidoreductase subunit M [Actinobacteria bacterium 69-20]|nr:NADH-quinone oxidoreductase subunit M [Actinomycetota bacterium]OJV26652.1 MAG: NADH-quinone oxidoreductase subunit M [Actinobacteria bacterium 69-20]